MSSSDLSKLLRGWQNLGTFLENKVHWKSKLSKYGINKSLSPIFVFFNEIFFCKDSADFWHRKMALKIRISLYLTFNTKSNKTPRTFLWPFSLTFGLVYSPLNSAMVSCWSEVTLYSLYSTYLTFQRAKLMTSLLRVWHLRTSLNIDFDRTTNFFFIVLH